MVKKEQIIKWYFKLDSFIEKFRIVIPFSIILAFTMAIPVMQSVTFKWLFAFCTLVVALDLTLGRLKEAFTKDITITKKIKDSEEFIKQIDKNIKKLEEQKDNLNKLKKEVKL